MARSRDVIDMCPPVPDYLRTKLELGLEKSLSDRQEDVQQIGAEGCKVRGTDQATTKR